MFTVIGIELVWFALYRRHLISPYFAIGLVLLTCGLATWIVPYITPVQISRHQDIKP